MKMMKKWTALLLALSLALALFGCAAQQPNVPDAPDMPDAQVEPIPQPDAPQPTEPTTPDEPDTPDEPADEPAPTVPDEGQSESWTGTIVDVFTEGGGDDTAQVVAVQTGESTVYFTLETDSSCVRASSGEDAAQSELVPGVQVEIEGLSFKSSAYHPISVIRLLEEETVNITPTDICSYPLQPTEGSPVPADNTACAALSEPPALTVINGNMQIEALRGSYEWQSKSEDDTVCAVIADAAHPLDAQQHVPALPCQPSRAGKLDAHTAYLCFDVLPDKLTVRCWSTDCWGDSSAESMRVLVDLVGSDLQLGAENEYEGAYCIPLVAKNCVYEVTATWSTADGCGGSASYSFYTRWADAEISPPRIEVYDK